MTTYYNEHDAFKADWLRNLIAAGHIAPGVVDTRSILDVTPQDLKGFTQCHFFAGVGVWSYALRCAGWHDERPVWTASCPCQPFSASGKRGGFADERHLWPATQWLVSECRPARLYGEQVASRDAAAWIDLVSSDMEGLDYAFGAAVSPASGYGAPHGRHRTYFVADTDCARLERNNVTGRLEEWFKGNESQRDCKNDLFTPLADSNGNGRCSLSIVQFHNDEPNVKPRRADSGTGPLNGFWRFADWLSCRDGKWRAVRPGTFPLAHGTSSRMGRLRAYGDAIVAPQAIEFIKATM